MQEKIIVLYEDESVRVERILSFGNKSPSGFFYDSELRKRVYLSKGTAILGFTDGLVCMNAGDELLIKPHQKHYVALTSEDCEWICIYYKRGNNEDI